MKKKNLPANVLLENWFKKYIKKGDTFNATYSPSVFVISKHAFPKNTK